MNENYVKFWAVWRDGGGAAPSKRHSNKEEAIIEANRLANASGEGYYVLEVVGIVSPIPVPYDFTAI